MKDQLGKKYQNKPVQAFRNRSKTSQLFCFKKNYDQDQFSNAFESPVTIFNSFDCLQGQSSNQFSTDEIDGHLLHVDSKIIWLGFPPVSQIYHSFVKQQKDPRHSSNEESFEQNILNHGQNGSQSILRKNGQNSSIMNDQEVRKGVLPISQISSNKSQTNSWKNFIMNFFNFIISDNPTVKQKFMRISEIEPSEHKFKKLVECLKKKIKKDRHTLLHMKSLLLYKDEYYTQYLLQMCERFLQQYPSVVQKSSKMPQNRRDENLSIIPAVSNLLTLLRDPIFAKLKHTIYR